MLAPLSRLADFDTLALAWLLTYLIHSTLLLTAATIVTRWLSERSAAWGQLVWRGALFGGLLTASLQVAFDLAPRAGRLELQPAAASSDRPADREAVRPMAWEAGEERAVSNTPSSSVVEGSGGSSRASLPETAATSAWPDWFVAAWMTGMLGALACFSLAWSVLCRRLKRNRVEIVDGPLAEMLAELVAQSGYAGRVRLWASPEIEGPLACGLWSPMIVLPERAIAELSAAQQRAMLAHELAHVVRRDPAWALASRLVEWLLFVQPLNRIARRKLEDAAEHLADAWAVEQTGEGVTLAGLLVEVAGWIVSPGTPLAAAGMASQASPLARRVERLLAGRREPTGIRPLAILSIAAAAAGMMAIAAPGVAALPDSLKSAPRERRLADPRLPTPPHESVKSEPSKSTARAELEETLDALDADLAALAEEVAELEAALRESPESGRRFAPILTRLARQVQSLRSRRDALPLPERRRSPSLP